MPLTPYENIVIGNFLYGLGLSLGSKAGASAPLGTIANTQQTPLDPILADVWLTYPGICRLLEFKRIEADMSKDRDKRDALADCLAEDVALTKVSRQIHWFAQIHAHPKNAIELKLIPYLDFNSAAAKKIPLADYISTLVSSALKPSTDEPSAAEVSRYLRSLGELSSMSSASSGGLMVHVNENGNLRYIQLDDIRDLNMQRQAQLKRDLDVSKQIEAAREVTYQLEIERQTRSHGMSR